MTNKEYLIKSLSDGLVPQGLIEQVSFYGGHGVGIISAWLLTPTGEIFNDYTSAHEAATAWLCDEHKEETHNA